MQEFSIRTDAREQFVDISARVQESVTASGLDEGAVVAYCPHTTAGITINENADPDVTRDMIQVLAGLVPCDGGYRHCEGNSDAHVKASMMGPSVTIPVTGGRLALGTWQGIYFCEFDGPRSRRVLVQPVSR